MRALRPSYSMRTYWRDTDIYASDGKAKIAIYIEALSGTITKPHTIPDNLRSRMTILVSSHSFPNYFVDGIAGWTKTFLRKMVRSLRPNNVI